MGGLEYAQGSQSIDPQFLLFFCIYLPEIQGVYRHRHGRSWDREHYADVFPAPVDNDVVVLPPRKKRNMSPHLFKQTGGPYPWQSRKRRGNKTGQEKNRRPVFSCAFVPFLFMDAQRRTFQRRLRCVTHHPPATSFTQRDAWQRPALLLLATVIASDSIWSGNERRNSEQSFPFWFFLFLLCSRRTRRHKVRCPLDAFT